MRQSRENQLPLTPLWPDHQHAQELREISKILDENSKLNELVWQDLSEADSTKGAPGMSGEQVLRCGVIKQMHQFSYDRLAFHLADSVSLRASENLSRIRHSTWQAINAALVDWACEQGLEKGEKVRIDATPVESEIHHPTDNQLLYDCVRVLARWLGRLSCFCRLPLPGSWLAGPPPLSGHQQCPPSDPAHRPLSRSAQSDPQDGRLRPGSPGGVPRLQPSPCCASEELARTLPGTDRSE